MCRDAMMNGFLVLSDTNGPGASAGAGFGRYLKPLQRRHNMQEMSELG